MADTDILVSEMTPASQINTTDLMIMTQPDSQAETGYSTKSGTVLQVANKMLKGTEYSTDLPDFTDKTPLGGLEELKADIKALLPVDSASGNPCTFETDIADTLVSLKAAITASGGNGTPSTPIPIVGHSELNLVRCGKNLADLDDVNATSGGGNYPVLGSVYLPVGTYTLSFTLGSTVTGERNRPLYGIGSDVIYCPDDYFSSGRNSWTFTITKAGIYQFKWWYQNLNANCDITDFQLELGSTATPYAPYNGDTFTVQFGQTVYGGVYDANGGKVRLTEGYLLIDENTPSLFYNDATSNTVRAFIDVTGKAFGDSNILSDRFQLLDGDVVGRFIGRSNSNGVEFYLPANVPPNTAGVKAWFEANNTQLVFELATPIEIDVSELSVDTIVGVNNITSDCGGDVEVEYRDSIQHYIDKKIAETQALIL